MVVPRDKGTSKSPTRKAGATRPDELSAEVCEFLAAIDDYRRTNMRSFLSVEEITAVLRALGYHLGGNRRGADERAIEEFALAVDEYKRANDRLFPSWSEIFEVARAVGWSR